VIRPAVPEDAPSIARVFVQAWRAGYRGVVADSVIDALNVAEWTADFHERIGRDGYATAVVTGPPDGPLLGFTRYGQDQDRPGAGYLASLYVDPESAGRGFGSQLLDYAIQQLTGAGLAETRLWVFASNTRARSLYERRGFTPTAERMVDPQWGAEQIRYRLGRIETSSIGVSPKNNI